ncbi:MAG: hypothetical protein ACRDWD_11055 [Acidimicrobiia bacterium]
MKHDRTLALAGYASLGAGAVHAVAIGMHREHRQAVLAFTVVAAFQLGWGALALNRSDRWFAAAGVIGNALLVGGWVLAKTAGIGFINGLETAEGVQLADGMAALLAGLAVIGATRTALGWAHDAERLEAARPLASSATVAIAGLAVLGMVTAGSHSHDHSDDEAGHAHGDGATDTHTAQAVAPVPYDPTKPVDLGGVEGVTTSSRPGPRPS